MMGGGDRDEKRADEDEDCAGIVVTDGFSDDEKDEAAAAPAAVEPAVAAEVTRQAAAAHQRASALLREGAAGWPEAERVLRRAWAVVRPPQVVLASARPETPEERLEAEAVPRVRHPARLIAGVASALATALHLQYGTRAARALPVPATATGGGEPERRARMAEGVELASVAANLFRAALGPDNATTETAFANWRAAKNSLEHYDAEARQGAVLEAVEAAKAVPASAAGEAEMLVVKLVSRTLEENDPDATLKGVRLVHRVLGRILEAPADERIRSLARSAGAVRRLLDLSVPGPDGGVVSAGGELLARAGFERTPDGASLVLPPGPPPPRLAAVHAICGAAVQLAESEPAKWRARSRPAFYAASLRALGRSA